MTVLPLQRAGRRTGAHAWVAAAAMAAALAAVVVSAQVGGAAAPQALADPGALTRWGTLVVRVAYDVSAIGTLGVLLVAVVLLPAPGGDLGPDARRLARLATRWASAWAITAALSLLLSVSTVIGVPVWKVVTPDSAMLALNLSHTRALTSTVWLVALVAVWSRSTRSSAQGRLVLVTAAVALLPPLLTSHAGDGESHTLALTSLALHVVAAAAWVGGLVALALHLRRCAPSLTLALPRYSQMALACFGVVAISGAVSAWEALERVDQLWTEPYGRLMLAKAAALVVLGVFGHRQRQRAMTAVARHRPRAFLALAAVEVVVMACAAGLAVGLSRTAPPTAGSHAIGVTQVAPAADAGSSPDSLS